MAEPLQRLLDDGVIDEVYTRLKTGKEAEIWLVRHGGEVVAAKVYKERNARNFKNNAAYLEGRRVRNSRTQRAIDKGSRFGQAAAEQAWKAKEAEALSRLHAAGLRVPKPVLFYEGVLLMEAILDVDGRPAPRLVEAAIPPELAATWYADLRGQMVRMLACDLIHGDLSPYNVLVAWNGPTVIDFPQVVGAAHNSQAERFFERDLEAIRRFLAAHDPALGARAGDAREIWRAFVRRELTPDFVPTSRAPHGAAQGERRHERPHGRHERREQPRGERSGERSGERRGGRPPERQHDRPQGRHERRDAGRQGPPAPRGSEPRRGAASPEVTVVQRLPGLAAPPRREGAPGKAQGQGRGHGHPRPHGHGGGHRRGPGGGR